MSELLNTLRAIVRDELGRVRPPELATVTQLHTRDVDTNANHEVSVKLIASGVDRVDAVVTLPWRWHRGCRRLDFQEHGERDPRLVMALRVVSVGEGVE